jgi:hypothetical protein
MNAKRVKSFRRSMRALGHDPRGVSYLEGKKGVRSIPSDEIGRDGKPKPHRVVFITGTVTLDPRCGRAMYKAAKAEARRS